jgi:hypothetical protein
MNVLNSLQGQRPKATDVSPWYGVYFFSFCLLMAPSGNFFRELILLHKMAVKKPHGSIVKECGQRESRVSDVSFSSGQTLSAPNIECELPRGRKAGGLRNRDEMAGTGRGSWRTDTMGLGGGPQGSNLFPQAGRLSPSRSLDSKYAKGGPAPQREPMGLCQSAFNCFNLSFSLYENI